MFFIGFSSKDEIHLLCNYTCLIVSFHLILQVLEKDLAIFGFFIALGRSTKLFLSSNGFEVIDVPIESLIR